jgi:tRNA pseudouridine55 synthase
LPEVDFRVKCSKGTYIRSLAFDFGKALQSGGYLSALRRTKIGDYSVENGISPEKFEKIITLE